MGNIKDNSLGSLFFFTKLHARMNLYFALKLTTWSSINTRTYIDTLHTKYQLLSDCFWVLKRIKKNIIQVIYLTYDLNGILIAFCSTGNLTFRDIHKVEQFERKKGQGSTILGAI